MNKFTLYPSGNVNLGIVNLEGDDFDFIKEGVSNSPFYQELIKRANCQEHHELVECFTFRDAFIIISKEKDSREFSCFALDQFEFNKVKSSLSFFDEQGLTITKSINLEQLEDSNIKALEEKIQQLTNQYDDLLKSMSSEDLSNDELNNRLDKLSALYKELEEERSKAQVTTPRNKIGPIIFILVLIIFSSSLIFIASRIEDKSNESDDKLKNIKSEISEMKKKNTKSDKPSKNEQVDDPELIKQKMKLIEGLSEKNIEGLIKLTKALGNNNNINYFLETIDELQSGYMILYFNEGSASLEKQKLFNELLTKYNDDKNLQKVLESISSYQNFIDEQFGGNPKDFINLLKEVNERSRNLNIENKQEAPNDNNAEDEGNDNSDDDT